MAIKYTKTQVDYSKRHKDSDCGICRYFTKPNACVLVAGTIDPEYWCRKFLKKRPPADYAKRKL